MYHLCPDPVTPQAPSQGRTACDFTTATISLGVFFKPHCTCEEDIYFLHKKEELSYFIKFPPTILFHFANIVGWVGGGFGADQKQIITRIVFFPCIPFLTTWKRLQMCNQCFELIDVPLLYEDGYYPNGRTRQCSVTVEPLDRRVIVHDDYLTDCNNFSQ